MYKRGGSTDKERERDVDISLDPRKVRQSLDQDIVSKAGQEKKRKSAASIQKQFYPFFCINENTSFKIWQELEAE